MSWTFTADGELLFGNTLVGEASFYGPITAGDYTIAPVTDHAAPLVLRPGEYTIAAEQGATIVLPADVIARIVASRESAFTVIAAPVAAPQPEPVQADPA